MFELTLAFLCYVPKLSCNWEVVMVGLVHIFIIFVFWSILNEQHKHIMRPLTQFQSLCQPGFSSALWGFPQFSGVSAVVSPIVGCHSFFVFSLGYINHRTKHLNLNNNQPHNCCFAFFCLLSTLHVPTFTVFCVFCACCHSFYVHNTWIRTILRHTLPN
jgi:hypothetical protein